MSKNMTTLHLQSVEAFSPTVNTITAGTRLLVATSQPPMHHASCGVI